MSETGLSQTAFLSSAASAGLMFDFQSDPYPTVVSGCNNSHLDLDDRGTHFGFVHNGRATISTSNGSFDLSAGLYFAVPGAVKVHVTGIGFVASRIG